MQLFSLSNKAMKDFFRLVKVEFSRIFFINVLLAILLAHLYSMGFYLLHQQGKVVNLPIVIVDQDNSPASDKIIDAFSDNEVLLVSDVRYTQEISLQKCQQYAAVITSPTHF
jgi:ABC-2 type transport system permease protein